jgi:hypothetical protein
MRWNAALLTTLASISALNCPIASAEINKCTAPDGSVTYSDKPCTSVSSAETITIPPAPLTPYQRMLRDSEEQLAEAKRRAAQAEAEADARRSIMAAKYWARAALKGIKIGMTKDQVLELDDWGSPNDVNTTRVQGLTAEQWVYRSSLYNEHSYVYLYFRNGILTATQN